MAAMSSSRFAARAACDSASAASASSAKPRKLLRRGEHAPLLRQPLVLAGLGRGLFQLVELEAKPVSPLRALRLVGVELGAPLLRLRQRRVRRGEFAPQPRELRVRVEHVEVERRIEKAHVLVLAADVEQAAGCRLELRGGGQGTVDPGAASPLPLQRAPHHQLGSRGGQPQGEEPRVAGSRVAGAEEGLHLGLLGPGAHRVGLRAPAEHEMERIDEDALARPGLAGEHVEAGREVHLQLVDDGERPDPQ